MNLLDVLRKLGIYRSGSVSGTYKNAVDRPTELQMEGVYDSKKDLVNKDDFKKVKSTGKVSTAVLIASIILGLFFLFLSLTTTLAWLVILIWLVWVLLIVLIRLGKLSLKLPFGIILTILFIITFIIIFSTQTPTDSAQESTSSTTDSSVATGGVNQANNDETYDCVFKSTDQVTPEPGYVADVFASEKKDVAVGEQRAKQNISSLNLKDFTLENDANLKQTVYFTLAGDTERVIPGVNIAIQLCNNETNKTTPSNNLSGFSSSPTSDNTESVETSFSWVQAPKQKGQYRIDGLAKFNNGDWKKVASLNVSFK